MVAAVIALCLAQPAPGQENAHETLAREILAELIAVKHGPEAIYMYGASSSEHRANGAAFLLQFEAMKWARAAGWIVRQFPTVLARRRVVQSTRKLPDRDFLSNGPIPFRAELASGRVELAGRRALDFITARYWLGVRRFL